jgi:hypothetical protein
MSSMTKELVTRPTGQGWVHTRDAPVGAPVEAVVAYVDVDRGYGYLRDQAGQRIALSRKFLGATFDRLRRDTHVLYLGNGRGGVASLRVIS